MNSLKDQSKSGKKHYKFGSLASLLGALASFVLVEGKTLEGKVVENQASKAVNAELENCKRKTNYELIKEYVCKSMESYVNSVEEESREFRRNIKKFSRKVVLEAYEESQLLCLELAEKAVKEKRDIKEEEIRNTGEKIRDLQRRFSGSYINYDNKRVIREQEEYAEVLSKHYIKLLKLRPTGNVSELVQSAYTEKGYKEYSEKQKKESDELYEAIRSSAKWFVSWFFYRDLNEEINSLKKNARIRLDVSAKDFYSEK